MAEHRHDKRVDCDEKCLLRLGHLHYEASVKNISFSGSLVYFYPSQPVLHIGNNCKIMIGGEFPREYNCEVVRVDNLNVALTFTGMHEFEVVDH